MKRLMFSATFAILGVLTVVPLGPGQDKAPPQFTYRKVALGSGEKRVATTTKEYTDEGWELVATADGQGRFRRPFVTADALANKHLLEELQGTWKMVSTEMNGAQMPLEKPVTITFKGAHASLTEGGKQGQRGPVQYLRKSGDLILADLLIYRAGAEDPDKGDTARVIIKVEGDTLKYCSAGVAARRPKAFATKKDDGLQSSVFNKVK